MLIKLGLSGFWFFCVHCSRSLTSHLLGSFLLSYLHDISLPYTATFERFEPLEVTQTWPALPAYAIFCLNVVCEMRMSLLLHFSVNIVICEAAYISWYSRYVYNHCSHASTRCFPEQLTVLVSPIHAYFNTEWRIQHITDQQTSVMRPPSRFLLTTLSASRKLLWSMHVLLDFSASSSIWGCYYVADRSVLVRSFPAETVCHIWALLMRC